MRPTLVVTGIDAFECCGSASNTPQNIIAIAASTSALFCVVVVVISTFLFQRSRRYRNFLMLQLKQSKTLYFVMFAHITSFSCYHQILFENINESASPEFIRLNLFIRVNKKTIILNPNPTQLAMTDE